MVLGTEYANSVDINSSDRAIQVSDSYIEYHRKYTAIKNSKTRRQQIDEKILACKTPLKAKNVVLYRRFGADDRQKRGVLNSLRSQVVERFIQDPRNVHPVTLLRSRSLFSRLLQAESFVKEDKAGSDLVEGAMVEEAAGDAEEQETSLWEEIQEGILGRVRGKVQGRPQAQEEVQGGKKGTGGVNLIVFTEDEQY